MLIDMDLHLHTAFQELDEFRRHGRYVMYLRVVEDGAEGGLLHGLCAIKKKGRLTSSH
jgi:hypothetical protein